MKAHSRTEIRASDDALNWLSRADTRVSHCPRRSTKCDRVPSGRASSLPLTEYVEREKATLVLSGNAHESRAIDMLGGSALANPEPFMEGKSAEVSLEGIFSVELKAGSLRG